VIRHHGGWCGGCAATGVRQWIRNGEGMDYKEFDGHLAVDIEYVGGNIVGW
jgi:hypothetical protein